MNEKIEIEIKYDGPATVHFKWIVNGRPYDCEFSIPNNSVTVYYPDSAITYGPGIPSAFKQFKEHLGLD